MTFKTQMYKQDDKYSKNNSQTNCMYVCYIIYVNGFNTSYSQFHKDASSFSTKFWVIIQTLNYIRQVDTRNYIIVLDSVPCLLSLNFFF